MSLGSLCRRIRYSKAFSRIGSPPAYRSLYFFHIAFLAAYSGCSRSMFTIWSSNQPLLVFADRRLRSAFLPQQVTQRVGKVRPAAILLLVDCVAVRLVRYLLEVLDQLLALWVHQQPYLAARRAQFRVCQHDPFPHAWVGFRHLIRRPRAVVHPKVLPHDLVIRGARGVLAVPRCVAVYHDSAPVIGKPLFELLASFMRTGVPQSDFVQHEYRPALDLRHYRRHRVHVEIQRPQQRAIRVRAQALHMIAAVEGAIHKSALQAQVLPKRFLLIKGLIVAVLQPFVEVRNFLEQVPVLVRLRDDRAVSRNRIRNEFLINPVIAFRRPHGEAAKYIGLWVAQPSLQP